MFFMQRCGCRLSEDLAGAFSHHACHTAPARIYGTAHYADVSGGWHDAGDYGRYVVPAAKAVGDLLLAYMAEPAAFTDSWNIPESGNGIPDILNEVRYELGWMKKMQREDGGVYHKVTCAAFPGFVMPQEEIDELILSPVSTAATGDFAAAMAMAYRVYASFDLAFAQDCLTAAKRAWDFLSITPCIPFTNPSGIVTGEYGDDNDSDERYWAACALFAATGSQDYHDYIKNHLNPAWAADLGWADVGAYGNAVYLSIGDDMADTAAKGVIAKSLLQAADRLVEISRGNEYGIAVEDFIWGSNMVVLNNAMLLLMAHDIQPTDEYIEYAKHYLDYIFGDNPMSVCYVTGCGDQSARHPHHRPSVAIGQAMPGMLVGGPDQHLHDTCAQEHLCGASPARCYIDDAASYSTNEVAIYWNSPLVYVMARLHIVK
jgi:endoglucanase